MISGISGKANSRLTAAGARYGVALGSVVAGWMLREALSPMVGQTALPFITFFPAVALAAWFGRLGPGAVATLLSATAANWFFIEPLHTFAIGATYDTTALAAFLISCLFIVGAMEATHRAKARALAELAGRQRAECELARLKETFAATIGAVATAPIAPGSDPLPKADASGVKPGTRFTSFASRTAAARWSAVVFAAAALIAGGVTLFGWFAGLPRLTDWIGSGISMFPNAAFGAVCSGAALILATLNGRRGVRFSGILGLIVLVLGSATLFQHLSGFDLGMDTMLVKSTWGEKAAVAPGRMGLPASTSFTLLGLALLFISSGRDKARRVVPALGIVVCAIAMLALMGYASGADPLFAVAKYTGIAMQTATVLLALTLAVLASVPEYEPVRTLQAHNAAGLLARRSLPFIIGLPLGLGWLRVRSQEAGWVDTAMGTSLLALSLVVIFCVLLWWWVAAVATHEKELAAARDLLATTLASIGDAVIATDSNGNVLFLNSEAERLTGWKNSEGSGQPLPKVFHIINEQTRRVAENPVERVFRTGRVAGLADHILLVSRDGTETPIDNSAAPIRQPDGPPFGVVLVFRDFTERKHAEEALRLAKKNAESANQVKDRFLATLSHELRTPLTPVLMLAAEYASSREVPEEVRRDFDTIRANISLEVRLIDDLLDLTRIEQGKFRLTLTDCDAHELVRKVADFVRAELEMKRITLRLELDALCPHLEGDAARLQQVIWNVIKNAIKFTPSSGSVTLRTLNESGMLVLVITDTGVGMGAENLTRVFDAFEQVEQSDSAGSGGLGLGLAISAGIVSAHHGQIRAESPGLGHGASFHISLPAASATPLPSTRIDPIAAPTKPLRILLVEDHDDSRLSLTRMLERRGHEVAQAETGARARELAASTDFDLVISDLGLPDVDGHALMRDLHDKHGLCGIALSGYGMPDDVQRSREAGFAMHLVKPVEMGVLDQAIAGLQDRAISAV